MQPSFGDNENTSTQTRQKLARFANLLRIIKTKVLIPFMRERSNFKLLCLWSSEYILWHLWQHDLPNFQWSL